MGVTREHRKDLIAQGRAAPEQDSIPIENPAWKVLEEKDAEIERLRADLDECDGGRWKLRTERDQLQQKLAEAQALLQRAYDADQAARHEKPYNISALMDDIEAFLFATAQPAECAQRIAGNSVAVDFCREIDESVSAGQPAEVKS